MDRTETQETFQLLVGGKEAFPKIIRCIREAKKSIRIRMFIWRDDKIGNRLAAELLAAAERGVKITIVKDRYGSVCEYSEESGRSFFHTFPALSDRLRANVLKAGYHPELLKKGFSKEIPDKAWALFCHPNVEIHHTEMLCDHSKFYIFDDEILIFGGINVEDKEIWQDMRGMAYLDYMVVVHSRQIVSQFQALLKDPKGADDALFARNDPKLGYYGIKPRMLKLIGEAQKELVIVMPYFSVYPEFAKAIREAAGRGVKITVVLPKAANFYDDSNKKTMQVWLRGAPGLQIRLSAAMVHAKAIMSEHEITSGSCNLNRRSLDSLGELNVFFKQDSVPPSGDAASYERFWNGVREKILQVANEAEPASATTLDYNGAVSFLESFSYYAENLPALLKKACGRRERLKTD